MSTLMPLLSTAGQGAPVLTGPVEVVWWTPVDLAPQGVWATLGNHTPRGMDLDFQGVFC